MRCDERTCPSARELARLREAADVGLERLEAVRRLQEERLRVPRIALLERRTQISSPR